jgi:hypothetical protein
MCYQCLSPQKLSSNPAHDEVFPMQHYAIQFVSDFFGPTLRRIVLDGLKLGDILSAVRFKIDLGLVYGA